MFIDRMKGQDYIDATRQYLDYLEEHLNNVAKAFEELTRACDGKGEAYWVADDWVADDYTWHTLRADVEYHDLSKFSKEEFVQYRDNFFPVSQEDKENSGFPAAWEHHKLCNPHHHETASTGNDIVHMLIDWMAMGYKFNSNPRDYYEKIKGKMNLDRANITYLEKLLTLLETHRRQAAST